MLSRSRSIRQANDIAQRLFAWGALVLLAHCRGSTAPPTGTAAAPAGTVAPASTSAAVARSSPSPIPSPAQPSPRSSAGEEDAAPAPPVPDEIPLLDELGRTLPQTEQKPAISSPHFQRAMRLLFEAIRDDRPEAALPTFFPVLAYREVKAVAQPERDWKSRLVRNFERDVHEYHRQLGPSIDQAELVGVEVHDERARWMPPGTEGNKLGYWRVLRSELRIRDGRGKERKFELTSLISWRGEWYIVHLHGFE